MTKYAESYYIEWISVDMSLPYWNLPLRNITISDLEIPIGKTKVAAISLADPFIRVPLGYFLFVL